MRVSVRAVALCLVVLCGVALAKRAAPPEVAPVSYAGIRYDAPQFLDGKQQNGGYVVATRESDKKVLWEVQVYRTAYKKQLEQDVQDVFITSLKLAPNARALLITNEKDECFRLDLGSRAVARITCPR